MLVIGCRFNTEEFIGNLLADGVKVTGILTITPDCAEKNNVPEYRDLSYFEEQGIQVIKSNRYDLQDEEAANLAIKSGFKFAVCIGWQRLIPEHVLSSISNGIIGMHPSQYCLPYGRGRSPINHGIINGAESLYVNIFRYSAGADEGPLLHSEKIQLTVMDTIHTVQQRLSHYFYEFIKINYAALSNEGLPNISTHTVGLKDLFYPKRTPEDGRIDWHWGAKRIIDFIRAQTSPYPGAFAMLNKEKLIVWKAIPYDVNNMVRNVQVGQIVVTFNDGSFVVATADGLIQCIEYNCASQVSKGLILE